MESELAFGSLVAPLGLTTKQQKLYDELSSVVSQEGIEIVINDIRIPQTKVCALDVEHNESGEFVGCGMYFGSGYMHYFSDLAILLRISFSSLDIIAHNGVSDIECLNTWETHVLNEQLYWDTMLIGHIIDSSKKDYSLEGMEKRELGIIRPHYDEIVGTHKRKTKSSPACPKLKSDCCNRITLDKQPMELVVLYNSLDVWVTWKLYQKQRKALNLETL